MPPPSPYRIKSSPHRAKPSPARTKRRTSDDGKEGTVGKDSVVEGNCFLLVP